MEYIIRPGVVEDLPILVGIVNDNVRAKADGEQGFLQDGISESRLSAWISHGSLWVVCQGSKSVGFACVSNPTKHGHPIIEYIYDNSQKLYVNGTPLDQLNYKLYGPVVIDKSHRGKGLMRLLFDHLKKSNNCEAFVGFVENENVKSLRVHINGLKFQLVDTITINNKEFLIMVYDLRT
mgnify:CR=1 FL=1